MLPHPLKIFEMQKFYQNEPKFNGVYSKNSLPKIKDWAFVINLNGYKSIGTHRIDLNANDDNVTYFDSFGVEYIPKEIRKFIGNKNIKTNVYRIQTYDSVMWGYYCIRFIDFMLKDKSLLEYANLFSPNDYEQNDKILLKIKRWKNYIALFVANIKIWKT